MPGGGVEEGGGVDVATEVASDDAGGAEAGATSKLELQPMSDRASNTARICLFRHQQ
jgi:hypothetical protein